jgi:hypothetical protein
MIIFFEVLNKQKPPKKNQGTYSFDSLKNKFSKRKK